MTRAAVALRAEITKSLGPGTAYLLTRLYLVDGTVLEQTNPGLPDVENDWKTVGRDTDLDAAVARLTREGWTVTRER